MAGPHLDGGIDPRFHAKRQQLCPGKLLSEHTLFEIWILR
jgi:hypothetical protein